MNAQPAWKTHERYDRRVRRARLSLPPHAPARHLAFTIEEALRLTELPGENEGRCYYFRHLHLRGLPADGDRRAWLAGFQRALDHQAKQAIYGGDPRAAASDAVFFFSEPEALEILLHRVLARRTLHEWFWPMVVQRGSGPDAPDTVVATNVTAIAEIIEAFRAHAASWIGVAAALFAVPEFDVVRLCHALPPHIVSSWVGEMDRAAGSSPPAAFRLAAAARPAVTKSLRLFGSSSAHTLWLTTLAVLLDSPAELAAGTAVAQARAALQQFAWEAQTHSPQRLAEISDAHDVVLLPELDAVPSTYPEGSQLLLPDASTDINGVTASDIDLRKDAISSSATESSTTDALAQSSPPGAPTDRASIAAPSPARVQGAPSTFEPVAAPDDMPSAALQSPVVARWYCRGLPTRAAGFFFLLNALQRIGIADSLASGLAGAGADFLPHLLLDLASHAGIPADDPISQWLNSLVSEVPTDRVLQGVASCWPSNLRIQRETASVAYLRRAWCVGARRWCRHTAKISVREMVSRTGFFSVDRTDLDVSLPLEAADIRVRKAGLDLDPGWLPWFGRVVRFHYLFSGELHV